MVPGAASGAVPVGAPPAAGTATSAPPARSVMAGESPVLRSLGWYPDTGPLEQRRSLPLGVQHVAVQEREHRLVPDPSVLRLLDPVVLVGEVQELRLDSLALQVGP